jgi:hypothetical protein
MGCKGRAAKQPMLFISKILGTERFDLRLPIDIGCHKDARVIDQRSICGGVWVIPRFQRWLLKHLEQCGLPAAAWPDNY